MSARKRQLKLTTRAREDFSDIQLYTERRWDREQRAVYKRKLTAAMRELTQYPNLGRVAQTARMPGLRAYQVERQVLFYEVDDETVTIIRILHERMDHAARLAE